MKVPAVGNTVNTKLEKGFISIRLMLKRQGFKELIKDLVSYSSRS